MKRCISFVLALIMLVLTIPVSTAETAKALVLPEQITTISAEAFAGATAVETVIISKSVQSIESRAFADCTGIKEVYFAKNPDLVVATDAFDGCGDIHFYAYPETPGELFALSHGYQCDLLEEGSPFLSRALELVQDNGGTASILQSSDFTTKRLVVRMADNKLPDISDHEPTEIVRDEGNIFFIQFSSVDDTVACYGQLQNDERCIFAVADACIEIEASAAVGVADSSKWDTSDPIGFTTYAPYVAENGSGKVTIAIIDSGVRKESSYSSILRSDGIDLSGENQGWSSDPLRHGSIIASIIKDCVGDARVDILPIRVVNSDGIANLTMIGNAIKYAKDQGADFINLSLNFEENEYVTFRIGEAVSAGIPVIVAAGNASRNIDKVYPSNLSNVVTVSGIDPDYELSAKSNYGSGIDFCAPDTNIVTTAFSYVGGGTSYGAPMIAAMYALVSLDPYHDISDVRETCRDLGAEGKDSNYGYGLPQLALLAKIDATGVTIDTQDLPEKLAVGESYSVSWTVEPENATNKTVTLSSSNEKVATVAAGEGNELVITAVASGTATITVASNSGSGVSATMTVTVVQPVKDITIAGAPSKMVIGDKVTLAASISPSNATTKTLTWKSTNPSVATVSDAGVVTAVSAGAATIYALANDGYGAESQKVTINVVAVPDAQSIVLTEASGMDVSSGSVKLVPGKTITLKATVVPENADQKVTYSCKAYPEGCVTVSADGKITAVSSGVAFVTVTTANGVSKDLSVEVVVLPTSVTIEGSKIVNVGKTITLAATVAPDNAYDHTVTWSSSNTAVAKVSESGVVTGVGAGTATITATANGDSSVYTSWKVTVIQLPTSVEISGAESINVGETTTLTATVLPASAQDKTVTWTSDNTAVATVNSSGVVNAVGKGTVNITATAKADPGVYATWEITTVQLPEAVTVNGTNALKVGDTAQLTAVVSPTNADNKRVVWASSDTSVATVSSSGVVTAVGAGETKITATAVDGNNIVGSINITVTPATFTITFDANGGYCDTASMTATRDVPLGWLPVPVLDYYDFMGWCIAGNEDTIVDASTIFYTTDPVTLVAKWQQKAEIGWVLSSDVPEGAMVVQHAYNYREYTESTSETLSGWTANGGYWSQTDTGAANYATFPSGYDKTNKYYTGFMKAPYTESETTTYKRTVSNTWTGYVYWHWAYNVTYASGTTRRISNKKGYFDMYGNSNANAYYFGYFYAMVSSVDCKRLDNGYCNNQYEYGYNCKALVNQYATSADKTNSKSGLATDRFFRFNYYTSTYTDYQRIFSYYRDVSMSSTYPTGSFSDLVEYVTYIPR